MATAFNPYIQTDLRDQKAQGANVGDTRAYNGQNFKWSGVNWDPAGGTSPANTTGFGGSTTLDNFGQASSDAFNSVNNNINSSEDAFLKKYSDTISGQETIPAMEARIGGELGLPQLRDTALRLQNTLQAIPGAVQSGAKDMGLSRGAVTKGTQARQASIAPAAEQATQNQQSAESTLTNRVGLGIQQQQKELLPLTQEASFMSDRAARQMTGYTTQMQSELQTLLTKYQSGIQMNIADKQRMADLAKQEQDYDIQKKQLAIQEKNANQPVAVGAGSSLYNPTTGKLIATAPAKTTTSPMQYLSPSNSGGAGTSWKVVNGSAVKQPSNYGFVAD